MSETITVRPATPGDAPSLGRLGALMVGLHHRFDARRFLAPSEGTVSGYGRFLAGEVGGEGVIVLVAEVDGAVAGYTYAALEGHDWMSLRGPAGAIHDLLVDEACRGRGIGRRLLAETLAGLAALGAGQVVLSTAVRNEAAQALFASAGFRPTMIEMTREIEGE